MRFLRIIPALLAAVVAVTAGPAQDGERPPLRADLTYVSRHVFRGVERSADSLQAAVELNRESLRGRLWTSQPFDRGDTREVKLSAGYGWQATEGIALEASVTHAWFNDVASGGVDRSFEAGLTTTLASVGGFAPSLSYYHDFRFRADTAELAVARSVALPTWGAFLELNFSAGWVRGCDWRPDAAGSPRRDAYGYWGVDARLPYRIGAHSTVVIGLHYADHFDRSVANGPFGRSGGGKPGVTLGVTLDF